MRARPRQRSATAYVDIVHESPLWQQQPESENMLRRAIAEAAADALTKDAELAIVLTDDSRIRELNRVWRGVDKPTNVLSFPAKTDGGDVAVTLLGDIVIAFETMDREAENYGMPFLHHLAHLAVHGFLHLQGYDHEADNEAELMERTERAILARLDIADPYAARDAESN